VISTTVEVRSCEGHVPGRILPETLVDAGSQLTWIPRNILEELGVAVQRKQGFLVTDGRQIERDIGYVLLRVEASEAPDLVVFAEAGDVSRLGAHSLAGLNVRIDSVRGELVPAGPFIAAAAA
jgi:predicted aspartyl protease